MDKTQIMALYDQDQRQAVEYPGMRREITPTVVRHIDTSGSGEGSIIYSRLNQAYVETTIRDKVRFFEGIAQDFQWKVYDYDRPSDLKERFAAYGFEVE